MRNLLYDLLVAFLRLVTRVFFRNVEVVGREHVPLEGAVIFVGNHPNSLMDPVLITTSCQRRVRFAAKDTLFRSWALRPALWVLGSVPIKRKQDHADGKLDNSDAFSALYEVLEARGAFGIFPEGISHVSAELAPLKTGAARIALGAAEKKIPLRIVPCGLSYRAPERMRGRVLIQLGHPITIDEEMLARHSADPRAAAQELTSEIDRAMRALTINAKDFETLRVLDGVRRLYKPDDKNLSFAEQAELMRRFNEHYERLKGEPDIAALFNDVAVYIGKLDALGLTDNDLMVPVSRMRWLFRIVGHLVLVLVYLPLALPGVVLHLPVLMLAVIAGETLTDRTDVVATIKMATITLAVLLGYAVIAAILFHIYPFPLDLIIAGTVLLLLLGSGWATIRVLERQATMRRAFWVLLRLFDIKAELGRLRDERESLRLRLLALVDKYVDKSLVRIVGSNDHAPLGGIVELQEGDV